MEQNPLGFPEEATSPEAPFLPDVGQRRRVVHSPEDGSLASRGWEDFPQEDPESRNFPHTEGNHASERKFEPYSKSTASHQDATYLICV